MTQHVLSWTALLQKGSGGATTSLKCSPAMLWQVPPAGSWRNWTRLGSGIFWVAEWAKKKILLLKVENLWGIFVFLSSSSTPITEECPAGLVLVTNKGRIINGPPLLKRQVCWFSGVFAEVGRDFGADRDQDTYQGTEDEARGVPKRW